MRLQTALLMIGLTGVLALLGLSGPVRAQEPPGDPERGATLYAENCLVCHGPNGEGRVGATLSDVFVTIAPDEYLKEVIQRGRQGTFMPAWSQTYGGPLSEDDILDLVAYIESWGTTVEPPVPLPPRPSQTIPAVPEVSGDPNVGYAIFQTNCVACHGPDGRGRIGATLITAFAALNPGVFAVETISRGVEGSLMPPFGQDYGGPLTDQEIEDVAAYVLSIQRAAVPQGGEVVGRARAWPLVIAAIVLVALIFALGVVAQGRKPRTGQGDTGPA